VFKLAHVRIGTEHHVIHFLTRFESVTGPREGQRPSRFFPRQSL